jgi:hypothetical protein
MLSIYALQLVSAAEQVEPGTLRISQMIPRPKIAIEEDGDCPYPTCVYFGLQLASCQLQDRYASQIIRLYCEKLVDLQPEPKIRVIHMQPLWLTI